MQRRQAMERRTSGVLLHPTSLPGAGPNGTLGADAFAFVAFLHEAGQRLWQMLPLGPPAAADSPYMATSAFAMNPLLLDAEDLVRRGWLEAACLSSRPAAGLLSDFESHAAWQREVLIPALVAGFSSRASASDLADRATFEAEAHWLHDYALFETIGQLHGPGQWQQWPSCPST